MYGTKPDDLNQPTISTWRKESTYLRGWRDDLVIKSTGCSFRGLRFNSQYPHGGSQLSITLVPGDLILHLAFETTRHEHSAHICTQAKYLYSKFTHTHIVSRTLLELELMVYSFRTDEFSPRTHDSTQKSALFKTCGLCITGIVSSTFSDWICPW